MAETKSAWIFLSAFLSACAGAPASVPIPEQQAAMAYGSVEALHPTQPGVEENLILRLYALPVFGESCFVETSGVCRNRYLLSVSSFDEQPEFGVFALPFSGQVTAVSWQGDAVVDHATLVFTVDRYTRAATANNPGLENSQQVIRLRVSPKGIEIVK